MCRSAVLMCKLISAFVLGFLDSIISLVPESKISSLELSNVAGHVGLCLIWLNIEYVFSRPYFFLILGLRIFYQNIKVGGGKKI